MQLLDVDIKGVLELWLIETCQFTQSFHCFEKASSPSVAGGVSPTHLMLLYHSINSVTSVGFGLYP